MAAKNEGQGTAERVLAAATELLIEEGYSALSMRVLGRRVGLSQAAIYRHFRDKAELVDRIVAAGYSEILSLVEGLDESEGAPDELLASGIRAYVRFATRQASMFKAILLQDIGPSRKDVAGLAPGVAQRRRSFGILAALLERGMAEGVFVRADAEVTAQAVWAAMFGLAARSAIEGDEGGGRLSAVVERQIELLLGGLRSPAEPLRGNA